MTIKECAALINQLSENHAIGQLQDLRKKLRGRPSRTYSIFMTTTDRSFQLFSSTQFFCFPRVLYVVLVGARQEH